MPCTFTRKLTLKVSGTQSLHSPALSVELRALDLDLGLARALRPLHA